MNYTNDDLELLAKLVTAEAGGEPFDGMLAVATVVLNRLEDRRYPDCLPDVIYQKSQFARPAKLASETCCKAAKKVLDGYRTFPKEVMMFQRRRIDQWYGKAWRCQIGAHNFYG